MMNRRATWCCASMVASNGRALFSCIGSKQMMPKSTLGRCGGASSRNLKSITVGRSFSTTSELEDLLREQKTYEQERAIALGQLLESKAVQRLKDGKTPILHEDILPMEEYEQLRPQAMHLRRMLKKKMRFEVGPHASVCFQNYSLIWTQVHSPSNCLFCAALS